LAEPFLTNFNAPWQDTDPYRIPTERFLGVHPYSKVNSTLQAQQVYLFQKPFYDIVMKQEERGFIGYNASGHKFRVFQDIIRMTLEEVLGLEFKKDFYFFRYPGDSFTNDHPDAWDFLLKYPSVNDNLPEQRNQLVSANFSLFNNFDKKYECSAVFFENAISYKPPNFDAKVALFFNEMGMETKRIQELFSIGNLIENYQAGILFQFFDLSHQDPFNRNAYEFMDRFIYVCTKKGVPVYNWHTLSELFRGVHNSQFLEQYRIVLNHEAFLNPYSSISMRRYDLNNPSVVNDYEAKLRKVIKSIPFDRSKADHYKLKLMQYWDLEG
jgi:hypothetical protein